MTLEAQVEFFPGNPTNGNLEMPEPPLEPTPPMVNGRPAGYLSPGDLEILARHTKPNPEPPMGHHDIFVCPDCIH